MNSYKTSALESEHSHIPIGEHTDIGNRLLQLIPYDLHSLLETWHNTMYLPMNRLDPPEVFVLFVTTSAGTVSFGELLFEFHVPIDFTIVKIIPPKMIIATTPIKMGTIVNIASQKVNTWTKPPYVF